MKLWPDLVYDVGVNNGDDTAYYLYKGYRVLGVEADPTFMAPLRERFAPEIANGRLTLINVALAEVRKSAPFWICEGYSLWNSFDKEVASRNGRKSHAIDLECVPLRDMFEEYGVPQYLKLSLHGQEHFCLVDIDADTAPTYLSLELPRDPAIGDEIFGRLLGLGYHGFKIIDQASQQQLVISPPTLKSNLRNALKKYPPLFRACEAAIESGRRILGGSGDPSCEKLGIGQNLSSGWSFPIGSSGPFGQDSHGNWQSEPQARQDWRAYISGKSSLGAPGELIWYDLHATR